MKRTHVLALERAPAAAALHGEDAAALLEARARARHAEAFALGVEQGAREALEGPARALDAACESFAAELESARGELARAAVELALGIARQLLRAELSAGNHDVEAIVRDTLARSGVGRGACVVHVSPADAERLRHVVFRAGTRIEADPDVPRGSVHVETPQGLFVRDVDACLEAVAERLQGEV